MEMLMFVTKIYSVLQNINTIMVFAENEMVHILEEIGDIHHRAAITALRDAKLSKQREREYASAITLLRPSYEAYVSAAGKRRLLGMLEVSRLDKINLYRKASQVALLCAVAYWLLDEQDLKLRYAQFAQGAFEQYASNTINEAQDSRDTWNRIKDSGTWSGVWARMLVGDNYGEIEKRILEERRLLGESLTKLGVA
jgi:hypothetical protein